MTTFHRCQGYAECAYWAEYRVTHPETGESLSVCANCVRLYPGWPTTHIER